MDNSRTISLSKDDEIEMLRYSEDKFALALIHRDSETWVFLTKKQVLEIAETLVEFAEGPYKEGRGNGEP